MPWTDPPVIVACLVRQLGPRREASNQLKREHRAREHRYECEGRHDALARQCPKRTLSTEPLEERVVRRAQDLVRVQGWKAGSDDACARFGNALAAHRLDRNSEVLGDMLFARQLLLIGLIDAA
jgi:hypothetical protein